MAKTYIGSTGNKYMVMAWPIIKKNRKEWKYRVSVKAGKAEPQRYGDAFYYDTEEEAEQELDKLAARKGWTLCEN